MFWNTHPSVYAFDKLVNGVDKDVFPKIEDNSGYCEEDIVAPLQSKYLFPKEVLVVRTISPMLFTSVILLSPTIFNGLLLPFP